MIKYVKKTLSISSSYSAFIAFFCLAVLFPCTGHSQTVSAFGTAQTGTPVGEVIVDFLAGPQPVSSFSIGYSFTRAPPVAASGVVVVIPSRAQCGGAATTNASATSIEITDSAPAGGDLSTGISCVLRFPLDPTSPRGTYQLAVDFIEFLDSDGNPVPGTGLPGTITIFDGGPAFMPPFVSYAPNFDSSITLPSTIIATPSGGVGFGSVATTTLNGCTINNATGPGRFSDVTNVELSFQGMSAIPDEFTITCDSGPTPTAADLMCLESRGFGSPTLRSWVLQCPAGGGLIITEAVSSSGEISRILLTAILVLIGMGAVKRR